MYIADMKYLYIQNRNIEFIEFNPRNLQRSDPRSTDPSLNLSI